MIDMLTFAKVWLRDTVIQVFWIEEGTSQQS
jgi:hypothetical protein